ncbi:hypothetical protein [Actinosynnema sp. NPDC020468]|uniref:hypothetical protein n=1 Tax=Actinosynnema sp. NPDC020468 TaxID=3154488 RepID=UPI0033CB984B
MTTTLERLRAAVEAGGAVDFSAEGATIAAGDLRDLLARAKPRMVALRSATITGVLDLEAGHLGFPVKFRDCVFDRPPNLEQASLAGLYLTCCTLPGLHATQVSLSANLIATGCVVTGEVTLNGAHVDGQVWLCGTRLLNPGADALAADGLVVRDDLLLTNGFAAEGAVRMIGGEVGGRLRAERASFRNKGGVALDCAGLVVKEPVLWQSGCVVEGDVDLRWARFEGLLDCSGADIAGAVSADGLKVSGDVVLRCELNGGVDLTGCEIGGSLVLDGGRFTSRGRAALDLARAHIAQNLLCGKDFVADGKLVLTGATVDGHLRLAGEFKDDVDLRQVTAGRFDDQGLTTEKRLRLNDFVYGGLSAEGVDPHTRITRLREHEYSPQIYLQLAKVYEAAGLPDDAKKVLVAGQDARSALARWPRRTLDLLFKYTVWYGFRPLRILWWYLVAIGVGWLVFGLLGVEAFVPKDTQAHFHPVLYTVDLLLPVARFGYQDLWQEKGDVVWVTAAFTFAGWILGVSLLAGLGNLVKRDR